MGKNAQTILRCLQEVDNSRPYFVAMMGERYGWHQEVDGKDSLLTTTFENAEAYHEHLFNFFVTFLDFDTKKIFLDKKLQN
jgi:hypothetical protein